jgi:RimJ/RimL family protein N-acetyltransferase
VRTRTSWAREKYLNGRTESLRRGEQLVSVNILVVDRHGAHDWRMIMGSQTRVYLVPFGPQDFDRLISWASTKDDLIEWCAAFFSYPLTHSQLEQYSESAKSPDARLVFTGRSIKDGPVGHIEVSHIWPHLSSRLSRVLVAPDKRHRGFGSAMVREAVSLSFERHAVDRIDLGVSARNVIAIGCYSKLGFAQVGRWQNAISVGSGTIDVV